VKARRNRTGERMKDRTVQSCTKGLKTNWMLEISAWSLYRKQCFSLKFKMFIWKLKWINISQFTLITRFWFSFCCADAINYVGIPSFFGVSNFTVFMVLLNWIKNNRNLKGS